MLFNYICKGSYSTLGRSKVKNTTKYFAKPMIEGQYGVLPARLVPPHIISPDYINNPKPVYGIHEGPPVKHDSITIQKLRKAAKVASTTLKLAGESVKVGMTTDDIDKIVHKSIIDQGAYPSPIGFMGFPKSVCTSVNEVCCHGIPNQRPLENGDSLNIDITCYLDGVHGDTSLMVQVGEVHEDIQRLIKATQQALYECIRACRPGTKFNKIGDICEQVAADNKLIVCELFTGHGIGHLMHMPPSIIHNYNDYPGCMEPGNVFTIEPIFLLKHGQYTQWNDNFTVISPQNPSAQWEHMVHITETGYEVLTLREGEQI